HPWNQPVGILWSCSSFPDVPHAAAGEVSLLSLSAAVLRNLVSTGSQNLSSSTFTEVLLTHQDFSHSELQVPEPVMSFGCSGFGGKEMKEDQLLPGRTEEERRNVLENVQQIGGGGGESSQW
ncbi:hypothetical protein XENOCAPTIV_003885, partial [Xenoophorus captivus]